MTIKEILLKQFDHCYDKNGWFVALKNALEGVTAEQAMARAPEIHERTWRALDAYRQPDECAGWWDDFVRQALGRPSALGSNDLQELRILTE